MHVFVTGATGFIGGALVDAVLRRGWRVTALVRSPGSPEAQAIAGKGATLAPGDVTNTDSMSAPMQGADCVIHNAAWYELGVGGAGAVRRMQAVNVDGTRNTLELAHRLGVPRIVHVSSIVAYGETAGEVWNESQSRRVPPPSPYEATKTEAHNLALELTRRGAPVMIAMPGAVVGAGDHANLGVLQRMYVRGLAPMLTIGGDHYRPYVGVKDCAEGIALIAEKGRIGESYILATGNQTYREIYEIWGATPGGMKHRATAPRPVAVGMGMLAEPVQRWLNLPNLLSREAAGAAYTDYCYTGEKARTELGWRPTDLRQCWLETLAEERRRAGKG